MSRKRNVYMGRMTEHVHFSNDIMVHPWSLRYFR
jgi:hypothetical protein